MSRLEVPKRRSRVQKTDGVSSEYLRAAQSLDQEVQNVKNLKRLSIGSIDLITDPELNVTVTGTEREDTSYDADLSNGSFTEEDDTTTEIDGSDADETSASIDRTRVEYLTSYDNTQESSNESPKGVARTRSLNLNYHANSNSDISIKERTLRGSRSLSNLKKPKNEEQSVSDKLFWVPANQHPNVKPENYLELVKETLNKIRDINTDGKEKSENNSDEEVSNKENINENGRLRGSIVRRPSKLRKSYTEFSSEDLELLDKALSNNRIISTRTTTNSKRLSLKEITNELVKHSNKAGLTDDNAVTLARTLSIASSVTNQNETGRNDQSNTEQQKQSEDADDDTFATAVVGNSHSLASNTSSLRRSKFNTYRVKAGQQRGISRSNYIDSTNRTDNLIARHTWETPLKDSYDEHSTSYHNKQHSILDSNIPVVTTVSDDNHDISGSSFSQDSSMVSSDSTSNSILNRPEHSYSYVSEKLDREIEKTDQFSNLGSSENKIDEPTVDTKRPSLEHRITGATEIKDKNLEQSAISNHQTIQKNTFIEKKERLDKKISNLFRRKKGKKTDNVLEADVPLEKDNCYDIISSESQEEIGNVIPRTTSPESIRGGSLISFTNSSDDIDVKSYQSDNQQRRLSDEVVEYVQELEEDSRELSGSDIFNDLNDEYNRHLEYSIDNSNESVSINQSYSLHTDEPNKVGKPKKLTFDDVKKPERANAPMEFTDSAFGFPLPPLTISTVIMCDHRLGINVERAIYRLSHLKLSETNRELRQQVLLSNFMYAYLNLVEHTLSVEEAEQDKQSTSSPDNKVVELEGSNYNTAHNQSDGTILIPELQ
ncbi:Protein ZDS2 [Nakaseomyces glabratus]|nr:Protein ZDS2 [Nakaseomyces glabratus]KTB20082.1 Protein ZDS2 [Nakaseomyces glabratus]